MKVSKKCYIKLFGINLIRIKKDSANVYKISICGIPFLSLEHKENKYIVHLWVTYQLIRSYRKMMLKVYARRKEIFKHYLTEKYKKNNKIKVCLLTSRPGMWSFDYLRDILNKDSHFETVVVVMPDPFQGEESMHQYLKMSLEELHMKGIDAISGWDYQTDKPLDLKRSINPDIVLYIDFWKPHFCANFYVTNFLDRITMLSEYGLSVMQDEKTCNFELNNLVDKYFRPTHMHRKMAEELMCNEGTNVVVVGSPKLDMRFDKQYISHPVWKPQDKLKKRVIWAPHHSFKMPSNM